MYVVNYEWLVAQAKYFVVCGATGSFRRWRSSSPMMVPTNCGIIIRSIHEETARKLITTLSMHGHNTHTWKVNQAAQAQVKTKVSDLYLLCRKLYLSQKGKSVFTIHPDHVQIYRQPWYVPAHLNMGTPFHSVCVCVHLLCSWCLLKGLNQNWDPVALQEAASECFQTCLLHHWTPEIDSH